MTKVSVIMPIYNVEKFVADAIESVLNQSHTDYELLIVDDCSPDESVRVCQQFNDPRIRIISHAHNRGLAGARNTGVRHANGDILAFLDSDDRWHSEKLKHHVAHLEKNPDVGLSFSRSEFMNEDGDLLGCYQMPKLRDISAEYLFARNPVGNGSAPVIRRSTLDDIAFDIEYDGVTETNYFDSRLRQSEDIECWMRIKLLSKWHIEGIPEVLTYYRLNSNSLSASILKQLRSWEMMYEKIDSYAPKFVARHGQAARAYQLRYLARQAIRLYDGNIATRLSFKALFCHWKILLNEPARSSITLFASIILKLAPGLYRRIEKSAMTVIGQMQHMRIAADRPSC